MYKWFFKRFCDIVVSLIGIVIFALPMLVISMVIKIQSPGPAVFKQLRSGLHRKPFMMLKFRSMRVDCPHDLPTRELDSEKYITPVGRFLRKTSLDELPQLFNILLGRMSFVGPRPVVLAEQDLIDERDKYGANSVKPGLTGWAQINGRDTLDYVTKAKLDGEYVQRMSFFFDMKCFLATFGMVFKGTDVVEGTAHRAEDYDNSAAEGESKEAQVK